jgi:hypothetical protein
MRQFPKPKNLALGTYNAPLAFCPIFAERGRDVAPPTSASIPFAFPCVPCGQLFAFEPISGKNRNFPEFRIPAPAYQSSIANPKIEARISVCSPFLRSLRFLLLSLFPAPLLFDTSPALVSFAVRFFREIPVNLISFASLTYGS